MQIEVVVSRRRVKTAQLTPTPTGVKVAVPASASKEERERLVNTLVRRYLRSTEAKQIDLRARARTLAKEYGYMLPQEIKWVENQSTRWGSCTPSTGVIRLSHHLAAFPLWVIDGVIAHELSHLTHRKHTAAFWALANRYPLQERSRGYLIARSETLGTPETYWEDEASDCDATPKAAHAHEHFDADVVDIDARRGVAGTSERSDVDDVEAVYASKPSKR